MTPNDGGAWLVELAPLSDPELVPQAVTSALGVRQAPGGGEKADTSPVDRGRMGLKRSMALDASGVPLGAV